jgi:hypothetical protein
MIGRRSTRNIYHSLVDGFRKAFSAKYEFERDIPATSTRKKMNLFTAVNDAMDIVLASDKTYILSVR